MANFRSIFLLLLTSWSLQAQQNPYLAAWVYNSTGITCQHWAQGQSNPTTDTALADVKWIGYTPTDTYIRCSGVPSYTVGPFLDGNPALPSNRHYIFRIPQNPVPNTGTPSVPGLGHIGVWINGVPVYNYADAMSYNNQNIWHQNAVVFEQSGFDCAKGHPSPVFNGPPGPGSTLVGGSYHHHQSPAIFTTATQPLSNPCASYPSLGLYTMDSTVHSPLLGFAFDGYPIYGAYAHVYSLGQVSIVRMQSSYQIRNITERSSLPSGAVLTAGQYGPSPSAVVLGSYKEDFEYVPGLGNLDAHNGRFAVTPEFPNGTYAYYTTVDVNWNSAFPYVIGDTYYGIVATDNFPVMGPGAGSTNVTIPSNAITYSSIGFEQGAGAGLDLYPNPTRGRFVVDGVDWDGTWQVTDLMGRIWMRGTHRAHDGTLQIDISPAPAGYYRWNAEAGIGAVTRSFYVIP